jgi:hypothetical protein
MFSILNKKDVYKGSPLTSSLFNLGIELLQRVLKDRLNLYGFKSLVRELSKLKMAYGYTFYLLNFYIRRNTFMWYLKQ